jgi:cytochrome c oxidase subunit 2
LNYLTSYGIRAHPIATLTWAMMIVSIAVVVIIVGLLVAALLRGRRRGGLVLPGAAPVSRPGGGASWIYVGVGVSTVVLFIMTVWTVVTLANVANPPAHAGTPLKIEVTGHQWWWEVRYLDENPARQFATANEIHIPVGVPVEVDLRGVDVIHSFWVPALAGKTDIIPGQTNRTWIEADRPGVYRGQCGEYCGDQHAHMAFEVIASAPQEFEAWRAAQLKGQPNTESGPMSDPQNAFIAKCGICHTVRGTRAGGRLGPDLTHLMSRKMIGAATLPNTPGFLSGWIADPQHIKPGNLMPDLDLSGPEFATIRKYLETLN